MSLWETLGAAAAGGVGGGIITVGLQQAIQKYRSPSLELDWFTNQGTTPAIVERKISTNSADTQHGRLITNRLAKDIHLILKNNGKAPARECQVKADIHEGTSKNPQPIRLGTRINPPLLYKELEMSERMRKRTVPFQINRDDYILIDLLRLDYKKEFYEGEDDESVRDISLNTLASFRNFEFEVGVKYNFKVTVTSANADPVEFRLVLEWDGSIENDDILNSINRSDSGTLYL